MFPKKFSDVVQSCYVTFDDCLHNPGCDLEVEAE